MRLDSNGFSFHWPKMSKISINKTDQIYFALIITMIQIIQKITIFNHVDICFSSFENNNLYAHTTHTTIHTAIAIGIIKLSNNLNRKFTNVVHDHDKS